MQKIAYSLTELLINEQIINKEEKEIYFYGLQLALCCGLTSVTILAIGWCTRQLFWTICFMTALVALRHYTGGYHAQSYFQCFMLTISVYLLMLLSKDYIAPLCSSQGLIGGSLVACAYLLYKGSINSKKNPKTKEEMQQRKRRARSLVILYSLAVSIIRMEFINWLPLAWILFYTQVVVALGLWVVEKIGRNER